MISSSWLEDAGKVVASTSGSRAEGGTVDTGVCLGLIPHHRVLQLAFSLHPMTGIWSQATSLGQLTSLHSGLRRAVLAFPPRPPPPTGQLHPPPPARILSVGVTAQGTSLTAPSTAWRFAAK